MATSKPLMLGAQITWARWPMSPSGT